MEEHPEFSPVINLVDTGDDLSRFISHLTENFAAIYLASPKNLIAYVHTVTGPNALRMLTPHLDWDDSRQAAHYALAGLRRSLLAVFGGARPRHLRTGDIRRESAPQRSMCKRWKRR